MCTVQVSGLIIMYYCLLKEKNAGLKSVRCGAVIKFLTGLNALFKFFEELC